MITTEDVIRATGGLLLNGDMRIFFHGVSTDSRTIRPGELFVALKGPHFDGHDFVLAALEEGAKGAIISRWPKDINVFELHKALSIIQVRDTLSALGDLAAYVRRRFSGPVVGITGSSGKSTTKELLATVLSERFEVAKNPGNWNNLIGVPLSILNAPETAEAWVLELATNQPGEIARLTEIASPTVAVLVGVSPAHLEGLGSFEGVLREKLAIFEKAPAQALWVFPFDQEEVRVRVEDMARGRNLLGFGLAEGARVRAEGLRFTAEGTTFRLLHGGEEVEVRLPLLGKHFVHDALAAAAAALALGLSLPEIAQGLSRGKTLPHRLEPKRLGPHLVLDDTYNANPASLAAACEVVAAFHGPFAKKIAVIGDMKELGEEAFRLHEEAGRRLAGVFDHVLAVGELAEALARGAGAKAEVFTEEEALLERLFALMDEPSLVLVKGSRAMQMEKFVHALEEGA
jgi:UDP-N-acetylmuramoyl-tripeptide--D-alanyl-D-alanine ligase